MNVLEVGAFAGCSEMTELNIPLSITTIYDDAFMGCSGVTGTVVIPEGVEDMRNTVFSDCTGIEHFEIRNSKLKTLSDGLFRRCTSLQDIYIPETIEFLKPNVFNGCSSLSKVIIANKNIDTTVDSANLFAGCTLLETAGPIGSGCDIEFAWETEIPRATFYNSSIQQITLPSTIKKIGDRAFHSCGSLQQITLPNGLEEIGVDAFTWSGLTDLNIPFNVRSIGSNIVAYCLNLREVRLNNISVRPEEKITAPSTSWFYGVNYQTRLLVDPGIIDNISQVFGPY
jgi:hypothetical protein